MRYARLHTFLLTPLSFSQYGSCVGSKGVFLLDVLHKNCCYNNRNWRALDCSVYLIVMFTIAVKVPRKHRGTSPSCSLHPSNLWLRHVNSYSKLLFSTTSTRFSYKRQRQDRSQDRQGTVQHYLLQQTSDRKCDATYYIVLHQLRTNHRIDCDSAKGITYSINYYSVAVSLLSGIHAYWTYCLVAPALSFVSFTPSPSDVRRRRKRAKTCVVAFPIAILSNLTCRFLSFPCFPWDTWPIEVSRQTERLLFLIVFTENLFVFVQVYARATHNANENKTPWGRGGLPYERAGDARRLAQGCKFQGLVSLRVFWAKHHYIQQLR